MKNKSGRWRQAAGMLLFSVPGFARRREANDRYHYGGLLSAININSASEFAAIINKHSLLNHPFYVAWSNGTLPVAALEVYAREYSNFIAAIPSGWEAVGRPLFAEVEREHAAVWDRRFAAALGQPVGTPVIPEVSDLLDESRRLFTDSTASLGALYAFEAQQPGTVASKLRGLREHYAGLPQSCSQYFEMHIADYDEINTLESAIEALSQAERVRAAAACERMCRALYNALTGIHAQFLPASPEIN